MRWSAFGVGLAYGGVHLVSLKRTMAHRRKVEAERKAEQERRAAEEALNRPQEGTIFHTFLLAA